MLVEDHRKKLNPDLTRQCPVTSWHCEACPWQWQAAHTPLYRLPLTLRNPGTQVWNTQKQFKDRKTVHILQCITWAYLTRGSSISSWTWADFYSWSSMVPLDGGVSYLHWEWMKSTYATQTHINITEISSMNLRNILLYIMLCVGSHYELTETCFCPYLYTALGSVL